MTRTETAAAAETRLDLGAASLWASAFVILALIIVQAGRLGAGNAAHADVIGAGDIVALTAHGGNNEDVLLVLDSRGDRVFVYGTENRNRVELYQMATVSEFFAQARQNAGGGPRRR